MIIPDLRNQSWTGATGSALLSSERALRTNSRCVSAAPRGRGRTGEAASPPCGNACTPSWENTSRSPSIKK